MSPVKLKLSFTPTFRLGSHAGNKLLAPPINEEPFQWFLSACTPTHAEKQLSIHPLS